MSEAEKDAYKEKFRPDSDARLDAEISDALGGVTLENLYAFGEGGAPEPTERRLRGAVKGRVLSVNTAKDEVFVDLGGKSQGIVPLIQFVDGAPNPGDELELTVDRFDRHEGIYFLTRKGAVAEHVSWENLEIGQVVEGEVTGMNKGGLELKIKAMRAFMPAGQVDIAFHKDISVFIGQRMQAEVTQFDREKKNLIVSRRNILEREKEESKQKMMAELAEGQVRRGTVRTVMDYGAFVDLGGIDGLLHVSEISHRRTRNPREVIKEGDVVDVKILKVDKETGKLSLSLKAAMADPWIDAANQFAPGTLLTARVARVEAFGAFLEAGDGIEGLLPVSEMSWQRIRHPSDLLKEGETVRVTVLQIDPAQKRLTFSLKQAGGDPWANIEEKYQVNMVTTGKVTRTADFGAFVELEAGLEGLVHISELASQRVRTTTDVVKPGQDVQVRILEIDKERRRIGLSGRRATEPVAEAAPPPPQLSPKELEKKQKKRAQLRGGLDF